MQMVSMSMFGSQSLQGGLVTLAEQRVTASHCSTALQWDAVKVSRAALLQCEPLPVARTTAATAIFPKLRLAGRRTHGGRSGRSSDFVVGGRLLVGCPHRVTFSWLELQWVGH